MLSFKKLRLKVAGAKLTSIDLFRRRPFENNRPLVGLRAKIFESLKTGVQVAEQTHVG
jgi:hypothetical protein